MQQKDTEHEKGTPPSPGYEVRDVDFARVLRPALALAVVTALTFVLMTWMLGFLEWRAEWLWKRGGVVARQPDPPPAPRLQVSPPADLGEMRSENEQRLRSYGWVDRPNGIVRIPVTRAMDLLLEEGLPVRRGGRR